MNFWRDIDTHTHRYYGVRLWLTGGEIYLGRRLYRWCYR